ncbi:hypothetical protein OCAE111667_09185 [Occultella aeris]|uniref:Lipoprotein n=1 Tax=Occultella aeris TaxID=2761496 RepID=A0A7M4DJU4_9MICO|nr:hypothetical protein [Occultella aeris]VZO37329.1 hypothetical protein HALOF300_02402 [Occultella aeris]
MRTRRDTKAVIAAVTVAVTATMGLGACDPADVNPTPTPTTGTTQTTTPPTEPSTEPPLSYEDQQIAAAEAFVIDYYVVAADVAHNGFEGWQERIFPFYAGNLELWDVRSTGYQEDEAAGIHTEGATEVVSITATDWAADPTESGFDTVTFTMCLDSRSVVTFNEDGSPRTDRTPVDHPYPATALVMGQPETDLGWSFMELEADGPAEC